ncbi:MAG TPA: dTDP-4-dehydrorhamnose reductase [Pyrinomonadaceae bacterium]|nr:dTDP-4-dehydrorhamnose reductase [Pyrinomonadaceae bacterium]
MKILIVGAGGFIGKEFARYYSNKCTVLALKRDALDITDREAVRKLIFNERPTVIINCAVLGVDACQINPSKAWAINTEGAEILAKAASDIDAEVLHISTNYVFDGRPEEKSFHYTIRDTPAPINLYGITKLEGERAVCSASSRSFIVRTSWVFGPGKKNFFSTVHRSLRAQERVRAATDVRASATYVRDFVKRVDEILLRRLYATYHVVNSGICSYHDFALEAARNLHLSTEVVEQLIEPVCAADIPLEAPRPRFTPMRCVVSEEMGLAPMRDWRAALADYIRSDCNL